MHQPIQLWCTLRHSWLLQHRGACSLSRQLLWKARSLLFQLGYCVNVGSSAWAPKGVWTPVGLIPVDQRDCPCLETAHITSLFPPLSLSRPDADQTAGTTACEAAFPTSNFHHLLCKTHLELIRGEDFSENGTGNALSDSLSHTLNGNLNKKHPHRCSLSLFSSVWKSCMEFIYRCTAESLHSWSLSPCGTLKMENYTQRRTYINYVPIPFFFSSPSRWA